MKVKDIIKGLNLKKGELFLIEGDIDILANKNLYERIKNKEVLYIDIDLVNDCKTYISIIENYDKMYNMSYVLIYKNKEGIVAVGDKAMSIVASLFPRRYKTLSLDATKVFKNDYFVVGFVGTAFVDIDKKSISIENVIKRLLKETKTIKEFVDKFDYICNNMEQCEYKKTATYGFF